MSTSVHFLRLSETTVFIAGHRLTLAAAAVLVIVWCLFGALSNFPAEWYLLSNMIGTMATLFILLIMQHSQNRDMHALQVKVDELIRTSEGAGKHWIGVEAREIEEINQMVRDRQASL